MASAVPAPWGVLGEADGLAADAEHAIEKFRSHGDSISDHESLAKVGTSEATSSNEQEVTRLARTFTARTIRGPDGEPINPFADHHDPQLDPHSDKFNPKAWMKTIVGLTSRDPVRFPKRVAGVAYSKLNVNGFGNPLDYQKTFGNYPLEVPGLANKLTGRGKTKIQILRDFDGLIKSGEMLVVLGRPGSGCTTLLKTISGETAGFHVDPTSEINYQGISADTMANDFRGECIYQAETDEHFPQLTVGQTLSFAAEARTPENRLPGVSRAQYAEHMRDITMATYGLMHTMDTNVGNEFVRGVSGGERKRVSIAEAALGQSPIQCWDNSTRGLDSSTALEFVRTLRLSTDLLGCAAIVAIYQASQSIYDVFDKVAVLYEGRQIYFGDKNAAKRFFVDMGFLCADRATTGDFLTSLTNPEERRVRPGFEAQVPRTPDEFAARWRESDDRAALMREIDAFNTEFPLGGDGLVRFREARAAAQAKHLRRRSPFTISLAMQIQLCMKRGFMRIRRDLSLTLTNVIGNSAMALVIGSVFYNLPEDTGSFYSRGALLFFAVLINGFSSALEILTLYTQRPIVEKHNQYAFYHPISEAISSMICDLPNKFLTSVSFNLILYFMTNLRREPGAFFIFYLFSFISILCMSMIFRTIGALSRSLAQAMAPAAIFILALIIYTGFAIPIASMPVWFRWINYVDPISYAFEALIINEFHDRDFPCSVFVPGGPGYANLKPDQHICSAVGAAAGANVVNGDAYIQSSFQYYAPHLWRDFGVVVAFTVLFCATYLVATEYISAARSKGEVLLFRRGHVPVVNRKQDEEASADKSPMAKVETQHGDGGDIAKLQRQTAIFHWSHVDYEINVRGGTRKLLDKVDGWIKPGTLTALMGASGAGKTTLLDVLASRTTMGVITGEMLVNGRQRNSGFQRKTGYVQQQDIHLPTTTVREALEFSALLRQPKTIPDKEKIAYTHEVIKILNMTSWADAVVGVPGSGLNVEQRKRLTIGVELAAKPDLLLFLDEPTSGLDSQTAWSICALLRKLADNGQAILCTIHQPSAVLFQTFDRLLFLASGGRPVYYGDIGPNSTTLTSYFERNGSRACGPTENPAEWMLKVIGAGPGTHSTIDWPQVWRESPERQQVKADLAVLKRDLRHLPAEVDPTELREYAAPLWRQLLIVTRRVFGQYWRTPSYLYSKVALCLLTGLFIGFSFFQSANSLQGLQNQLFSVFMLLTMFGNLAQQIMPHFVTQRALYEVRERQSKTYSWIVFMGSNIIAELPWQSLMAVVLYVTYYYPVGLYRNAQPTNAVNERGALVFLFVLEFMLFTSTFTHAVIAAIPTAETAGNVANLLFSFSLIFCGVLAPPQALPGFWIFMYRVSPFNYLVNGLLSSGIANTHVVCAANEYGVFNPPAGQSCGDFMAPYIASYGGYVLDPAAKADCHFCSVADTNVFLASLSAHYSERWRNVGILFVFIAFNIAAALFLYWLARVPAKTKVQEIPLDVAAGLEKVGTTNTITDAVGSDGDGVEKNRAAASGNKDLEAGVTPAATNKELAVSDATRKEALAGEGLSGEVLGKETSSGGKEALSKEIVPRDAEMPDSPMVDTEMKKLD